ncbi:type II toxin-antitoxin system HipA family toxin [bacterium]|nr:type II toxin-antitoxin system HipA family toxin [bacterium]
MTRLAEVKLWGKTIGAVALEPDSRIATFEYMPEFVDSGIELSPLVMPLSRKVYSFPYLPVETFAGLPGLLSDSLPDKFGSKLIDQWLATQHRSPDSMDIIERLCYTGSRGMGALEYYPSIGFKAKTSTRIQVDKLVELASEILTKRTSVQGNAKSMEDILRVGTSAGGARAKALIAWNRTTNEVRSGQIEAGTDFEYWLLKLDGVSGNRDNELNDPQGYGSIEYAYYKMAIDSGINMNECRLFEENGRRHFMTRRFDRSSSGAKLHMQSLCAMAHFDYNQAGAYGYEQLFLVMDRIGLSNAEKEQQYRRMIFNVIARNQDDHVKNIAFMMDKSGRWSLSPAFDVIYSYQPGGRWTSSHQMTINNKRDGFTEGDFAACAGVANIETDKAESIIEEVKTVVGNWTNYADEVGVNPDMRDKIQGVLRI